MAYVSVDYYQNEYEGVQAESEQLQRLIKRAERDIDTLTSYQLLEKFDKLSPFHTKLVKNAVCSQVEFLLEKGETASSFEGETGSVTIGSFSKSNGSNRINASQGGTQGGRVSRACYDYLFPTGLLYKGVWMV